MRFLTIPLALLATIAPETVVASCGGCWSLGVGGPNIHARMDPTLDASGYAGFVIYRQSAEYCDAAHLIKVTPEPLTFGVDHSIPSPTKIEGGSYIYFMRTVAADGSEGYPEDLCEFDIACLGFPPSFAYEAGPLGFFLGKGYLTGSGGRYEFENCGTGCDLACWTPLEGRYRTQELDAIAANRQAVYLWGDVEFSGDWCTTTIRNFGTTTCSVESSIQSWGGLKARF